jgi:hypothetical protein
LLLPQSGSGISQDKQELLFAKFQESLDSLSQGTGIGLFLCKNLTYLLGGELRLDPDYDSGVPGCPGARFVVDLKTSPLHEFDPDKYHVDEHGDKLSAHRLPMSAISNITSSTDRSESNKTSTIASLAELPTTISVLFVDDDLVLRKLFSRSVKKVAPNWVVREASNGETALRLAANEDFDLM